MHGLQVDTEDDQAFEKELEDTLKTADKHVFRAPLPPQPSPKNSKDDTIVLDISIAEHAVTAHHSSQDKQLRLDTFTETLPAHKVQPLIASVHAPVATRDQERQLRLQEIQKKQQIFSKPKVKPLDMYIFAQNAGAI